MLSVCVSASSTDGALCTTAFYRTVLGVTSTADDANQQLLVAAASAWANDYVGYPLLAQTYAETIAGYGVNSLLLSRRPIRRAFRLFNSTSTNEATEYCSTDYRVDRDAGIYESAAGWPWSGTVGYHLGPYVVPRMQQSPFYAEYQAGYIFPGTATSDGAYSTQGIGGTTSTGPTLPQNIQYAVALKAVQLSKTGVNVGVQSKKIGDLSITYGAGMNGADGAGVSPESLLDPYKSVL